MNADEVRALLAAGFEDCEVRVDGQGNHFDILVVGDIFAGQRPVQRQQRVYAALKSSIADGSIHAVNMKLYTRAEWQNR